ncbi:RNA polymerase sigma factor [Nocardiopsis dassonvillei]|uniref:RNA polymerase sigma factor n=1 Tax=Nocardiopsis dassonvillei TaxID=2014 RepID=UPI003670F4A7
MHEQDSVSRVFEAGSTPDPEEVSWDYLVQRELPSIAVFLKRMGATDDEAKECAQHALSQCWERRGTIKNMRAYLRSVARNTFLKRPAEPDPIHLQGEGDHPLSPSEHSPHTWAQNREIRDEVLEVIRNLPPTQRAVIALIIDEFSTAEIAKICNLTPRAVRTAACRARKTLKIQLAHLRRKDSETTDEA